MNASIGFRLRLLRKGKKLTQEELSKEIGINRSTLSNYEINRRSPSLADLKRFCEFYGVGLDYFGVSTKDEIFDLLTRAKEIFQSDEISKEEKEELYKEIMRLYLALSKGEK